MNKFEEVYISYTDGSVEIDKNCIVDIIVKLYDGTSIQVDCVENNVCFAITSCGTPLSLFIKKLYDSKMRSYHNVKYIKINKRKQSGSMSIVKSYGEFKILRFEYKDEG